MCDHEHYEGLDNRIDELDKRVTLMETTQNVMREELNVGFKDLKEQFAIILEERRAWSKWARENLPAVGRWLAKWGLIFAGAIFGVQNMGPVIKGIATAAQ